MIIFGIDPGTATTGYGVVKINQENPKKLYELIEYGCIVTSKDSEMPLRLLSIQKDLSKLLQQFKPNCVSIEQLFFGVNSRTAMTVGQARGVILATTANYRIPIFEYQGLHVKHTITGSGKADKKEMQKWVMKHLGKRKLEKPKAGFIDDAADAVAVAICHHMKLVSVNSNPNVVKKSKVGKNIRRKTKTKSQKKKEKTTSARRK